MATATARRTKGKETKTRRRIAPEDIARFALLSDPRISPSGEAIIFVRKHVGEKNEYVTNLWTVPADGGTPRQFTSGARDSHPRWSRDGSRLAFIGGRKKTQPQVHTISASGGEATQLTRFPEGSIGTFAWAPDGRSLAVSFRAQDSEWTEESQKDRKEKGLSDPPRVLEHWWYRLDGDGYFNAQRYAIYIVDAETGEHRVIYARDTMGFFTFDFSPDSKELVVSTNRDARAMLRAWNDDLLRIRVSDGKVTPIPDLPKGPKEQVAWSPDGKLIAYAGREGNDPTYSTENLDLWVCDPVRGRAKCLTGGEDYCLLSVPITDTAEIKFEPALFWHPDGRRVVMQLGWHGECHIASVAREGGPVEFHTHGARVHLCGSISADGKRLAMTVGSFTKLDEVGVLDMKAKSAKVRTLTDLNGPLLSELELSTPKSSWVRTADGTRVQVWEMLPVGVDDGRKCPAVLEIHGGPHAQYGVGFFHEFQVLAANGYAVYFSNPRGSKGYGRDHCHAIRGRWGDADWVDIQAVTAFMKSQPHVDAKRMGVMGGSYGGYMTNWVIGHTNDFAAAITDRCVSNVVTMDGTSDFLEEPGRYFPGNHWDDIDARWVQSPIKYMGQARTPLLIIHSEGDLRCNIEQAEQVFTALTLLGVESRFVRYPRSTSHGMSRTGPPDLRLHRLHQILAWWERHLKGSYRRSNGATKRQGRKNEKRRSDGATKRRRGQAPQGRRKRVLVGARGRS